ncbi:23S rRNA (uracil(1939)-C(5))-methyltransferase RlmD [Thalassotalea euphylliae]|uniref:23S rRNA (uracil(1939)-C(5))-methyltransferase RlmD n=1 Tax=Thalassotalea euphylliae TaxID=1655234 RepID=A0A3E0U3G4_9GAMM|nr:23S rRNA (uracil(1939)-C(5))-methyltransferase RlmD [Thalassotalea euphylliae]REL30542.1 23S rRNA (uracil(1939)-C(5))-methyltransferase RlmD [Thalassotalea euphylliae]
MAKIFQAPKSSARNQKLLGQVIKLTIDRLDVNGIGVGRYQKKPVFVANTLVGEHVQAKVIETNSKFIKAKVVKVAHLNNQRQNPVCEHYYVCGGCDLQHLSHQGQLTFKQQKVTELFARQGLTALPWQPAVTGRDWHYRRKARIGVQYNKLGEATLGFRQKESNTLVPIKYCHVLSKPLASINTALANVLEELAEPKSIGHIEVIQAKQTRLVIRQLRKLSAHAKTVWQQAAKQHHWQVSFDYGDEDSDLSALEETENQPLSYELDCLIDRSIDSSIDGSLGSPDKGSDQNSDNKSITIKFAPNDFIQVNDEVNQLMVKQALNWLELAADDVVLDLFCGLGNFSLPMAKQVAKVVGVEGVQAMVDSAAANAGRNQITNAAFYQLDLNSDWQDQAWQAHQFNKVLLDPARAGALEACEQLATIEAKCILYVSCDPQTLARDAKVLSEQSYQVKKIGLIDMFNHTKHVETMVLFERIATN